MPEDYCVRVSWHEAMQFCQRLSDKSGLHIWLPTESQSEWACRAGTATPMWYGGLDDGFSTAGNLAGREEQFAFRSKRKWYLRDDRYDDGALITATILSPPPAA